jgi:nucleoside-diphosphate-sugar epimerase
VRILLTGGSGFIGQSLRDALSGEHEIIAPSHRDLDVTDTTAVDDVFRRLRFDAVIHAAVEGGDLAAEKILRGFWNIARHANRVDRILYFGSGAEYGKHRDLVKVTEEEIGREIPCDSYGFGKLLCNEIACRIRNILNLRLFGVYGPREDYLFKFISNSIAKAILGIDLVVRQDVVFDYLWVEDLCAVVRRLIERDSPVHDLNLTPTESISLSGVLEILREVSGLPLPAVFQTPGWNLQYTGDNGRLRKILPDLRFTPPREGIRKLYDDFAARAASLDREALRKDEYSRRCRVRVSSRMTAGEN